MSFPPSSPVAGNTAVHYEEQDPFNEPLFDIFQSGLKPRVLKNILFKTRDIEYPTPNPSSSIGRSSSPIRGEIVEGPTSPTNLFTDYGPTSNEKSKSSSKKVQKDLIHIELNPNESKRLVIGRKGSLSDIILPSKKNISREHASITYMEDKNQIKLECLGTNGLVVILPRKLYCQLIKRDPNVEAYELSTATIKSPELTKKLVKTQDMSSFVLLKGETVIMPYIKGTTIDFRQAEAVLSMKQLNYLEDTEPTTTDEFNESVSELSIIANIPMHTPSIRKITPQVSFDISTPSTPIKVNHFQPFAQETPLPESLKLKPMTTMDSRRRKLDTPSPRKKDVQHKHKGTKSTNTDTPQQSNEEIVQELLDKGVDCDELRHVLANHLAYANVQQTPLSQLITVNSKTNTLTKVQLRALLAIESCIGIIYRQGKDAAGKPLEEEYYYDLENDPDQERKDLVSALKGGRTGLRSCRRTHKQYFWKKPTK